MLHFTFDVHLQVLLGVGLAVFCFCLILGCVLCWRRGKPRPPEDKEAAMSLPPLPADHLPAVPRASELNEHPKSHFPLRRLSTPPAPPTSRRSTAGPPLPSLPKLGLVSKTRRALERRCTVTGDSFLDGERSRLQPGPAPGLALRAPSAARRRSLSPEFQSQTFVLQVGSVEQLRGCALQLAVFARDFSGLREAPLGDLELPCGEIDWEPDYAISFTKELRPAKYKLRKSLSSVDALSRKEPVCIPRVLGQLFVLLQYQTLAHRIKVMVRKAENLAKLTRMPGAPDHYVVINLRKKGVVIGTKETKGAGGYNAVWNAPFLFDLPPGDVNQLPLVLEFIVMQGRIYTKGSVLGRVLIGREAPETGQTHWKDMCSRGQVETARWHAIQPDSP
ncbi:hypothetical protein ANANG_G00103600 [Anguilla anguilla]|uniref:C2 domain-containing protein n=1 Tax=Anguilla anguilla TaxID=7936 RepID=A0A9D3S1A1_ANGAN|nr:hypothetical protein ANANG_G00103600 [Anguilla anguilla]